MSESTPQRNKAFALEAFETFFNREDFVAAEKFWSRNYIQHSAHTEPGREGLFNLVKSIPATLKYESESIVAEGNFVIVHGRCSGMDLPVNWVAADRLCIENGLLAEHWDVLEDEVTREKSASGLPIFGAAFPS